jgi:dTMP kinase
MSKGIFITFEGPEGSGKTTHIQLLASFLRKQGRQVVVTREPGGTALAGGIRRLLLEGGDGLAPKAELLLYEADRAQHVHETLLPALRKRKIVICDRYTDSTLAYQGDGRRLDHRMIGTLNAIAAGGLKPDLTILLDVPVKRGLRLAMKRKKRHDRLERAGLAFHQRVRRGFLRLAKKEPGRFRVIEQQPAIEQTQELIRKAVSLSLTRPAVTLSLRERDGRSPKVRRRR